MAQAKQGDIVRVHYHGTLEDGTVFSSTYEEKEPFEFTIGKGSVLPGFEQAVIGMNVGDTKSVSIPPGEAYGQHRQEFVFVMNRAQAPAGLNLELGKKLQIRTNQGETTIATITAITEDSVVLDANDPLAGKSLNFEIELIEIFE
jgi:peptidylprolyl isomerase